MKQSFYFDRLLMVVTYLKSRKLAGAPMTYTEALKELHINRGDFSAWCERTFGSSGSATVVNIQTGYAPRPLESELIKDFYQLSRTGKSMYKEAIRKAYGFTNETDMRLDSTVLVTDKGFGYVFVHVGKARILTRIEHIHDAVYDKAYYSKDLVEASGVGFWEYFNTAMMVVGK